MSAREEGSVSEWIRRMKAGDAEAENQICQRFFAQITALARKRLAGASRRVTDEEDVAISVFHCLHRGIEAGRFADLKDRFDLWRLLATITLHKAVDQRRRDEADKRGAYVRGDSCLAPQVGDEPGGFDALPGDDLPPEFDAQFEEQLGRLLDRLKDDTFRRVVTLRLEGYTNAEIAEKLGVTESTVERKLRIVREKWQRETEP